MKVKNCFIEGREVPGSELGVFVDAPLKLPL